MIQNYIRLLVIVLLAFPVSAIAQTTGGTGSGSDYGGGEGSMGLSPATTGRVTRTLKNGTRKCRKLGVVHRYDCYRGVYRRAANILHGRPAYREAMTALIDVERSLDQFVTSHGDTRAKPTRRGYRPIQPAAVPKAAAEFNKALDQAETKLLRSSDKGNVHYARIAEAVHSNKVLLRSQLDPGLADKFRFARLGRRVPDNQWADILLV